MMPVKTCPANKRNVLQCLKEQAEETVAHILSKQYTLQWLKDNKLPAHFVYGDV